jgi:hypothetical protein
MNFRERLVDFGAVGAMNWTAMAIYVEFGLA